MVRRIARITSCDEDDVLSDILTALVEVRRDFEADQYRHRDRIYEIVDRDNHLVLLRTPKKNKHQEFVWAVDKSLIPLEKRNLATLICREMYQQNADILTAYFSQKNGFIKQKDEMKYIFKRRPYLVISKKEDIFVLAGASRFRARVLKDVRDYTIFEVLDGNNSGEVWKMRKSLTAQKFVFEVSAFEKVFKNGSSEDFKFIDVLRDSQNIPEDRVIAKELYEKRYLKK